MYTDSQVSAYPSALLYSRLKTSPVRDALNKMAVRYFNLVEAESHLPAVESLLRSLMQLREDYRRSEAELARINLRITAAGGMIPPREEIGRLRRRKDAAAQGLKSSIEKIEEIGCLLKDVDTGLIDFPTLYRGQEVYLCWKLGEAGIGFWHPVEEGFRGRRPIDSDFLANHQGDG